jgi:hypothetical protein
MTLPTPDAHARGLPAPVAHAPGSPAHAPGWRWRGIFCLLLVAATAGCGTSRFTDTSRTATEQLLVSSAVDQAIDQIDFQVLAGKKIYLDDQYVEKFPDRGYVISSLRQHLLAHGCLLQEDRKTSEYVVEARAGAVGTDRHDLLYGVPQVQLPSASPFAPVPATTIPEIPVAKRTEQKGVAKLAVFAYNRETGRPVWQSGIVQSDSTSKDLWVFGAGPFRSGTIRKAPEFGSDAISIPLVGEPTTEWDHTQPAVSVTQRAVWEEPQFNEVPDARVIVHQEEQEK